MQKNKKKKIWFSELAETKKILRKCNLHSVCEESRCPNISECFRNKTATFLILGNVCTRNCSFCNVSKGRPSVVDEDEPRRVAEAVESLGIEYVVVTSVTRDDLADGGAGIFARTVKEIKLSGRKKCEVLIPDFRGDADSLKTVIESSPEVISHNIETVRRLYPELRSMADYGRSLNVLKKVKESNPAQLTKSGIMLGLGETGAEVIEAMKDIAGTGCDFLSIGQYLAPSNASYPVKRHLLPEEFEYYRKRALELGFRYVESGTYVRTSYNASRYL